MFTNVAEVNFSCCPANLRLRKQFKYLHVFLSKKQQQNITR